MLVQRSLLRTRAQHAVRPISCHGRSAVAAHCLVTTREQTIKVGDVVEGVVQSVRPYGALVGFSDGITALLHKNRISRQKVEMPSEVFTAGDMVKVYVTGKDAQDRFELSTSILEPKPGDMLSDPQLVYDRAEAVAEWWRATGVWDLMEGEVVSVRPFGVFIDIRGGCVALLPASEVSFGAPEAAELEHIFPVGSRVKALVAEIDTSRGRVTLSTRHLEATPGDMLRDPQLVYEKAEEEAERWRQRLKQLVGQVVEGVVQSVQPHGVILDIVSETQGVTGIQGYMPFKEVSQEAERSEAADTLFSPGDKVKALVMRPKRKSGKLQLSSRLLEREAAWAATLSSGGLKVGDLVEGVVLNVTKYGAFVELPSGYTALLHVSQVSQSRAVDISRVLKQGDRVKALILSVDNERGRVALSTKKLERTPGDMLRDPRLVYDQAEEMAERFRAMLARLRTAESEEEEQQQLYRRVIEGGERNAITAFTN